MTDATFTPRRILVATDFSDGAAQAMERAATLSRALDAALLLLHVVPQNALVDLARMLHEVIDEAKSHAEKAALHDLRTLATGLAHRLSVTAGTRVTCGPVVASIIDAANRFDADLLVLGARGANPVRDFLLGSNAERTLRKAERSLLIVRQATRGGYRQVLVPVDFSAHARHALQLACAMAPDAVITALHVFDAPLEARLEYAGVPEADITAYRERGRREAEARLHEFLVETPGLPAGRVVPQVEIGYPAGVILDTARRLGADLVALGKHGRSPVEEWVLGSVTIHTINNAPCDVLAADRRGATE